MSLAAWCGGFLVAAVVLANLPFLSERILLLIPDRGAAKRVWVRIVEWFVLWICTGLLAAALEYQTTGAIHDKGWEFYSVGFFIFLVFAFPGILLRYGYRNN